jgi:hypothetical protein
MILRNGEIGVLTSENGQNRSISNFEALQMLRSGEKSVFLHQEIDRPHQFLIAKHCKCFDSEELLVQLNPSG